MPFVALRVTNGSIIIVNLANKEMFECVTSEGLRPYLSMIGENSLLFVNDKLVLDAPYYDEVYKKLKLHVISYTPIAETEDDNS